MKFILWLHSSHSLILSCRKILLIWLNALLFLSHLTLTFLLPECLFDFLFYERLIQKVQSPLPQIAPVDNLTPRTPGTVEMFLSQKCVGLALNRLSLGYRGYRSEPAYALKKPWWIDCGMRKLRAALTASDRKPTHTA